jgi:MFS family permease
LLGVALHGLCYDFFFVTGFIYTDKRASARIRGQAQGMIVLLTYGLGLGIGGYLVGKFGGYVFGAGGTAAEHLARYPHFWVWPAGFAAVVLVIFTALFRDDSNEPPIGPADVEVAVADGQTAEAGAPR